MLGVRLLEDYVVIPRVLGEAVGLSPLLVLFSVSAVTILFGSTFFGETALAPGCVERTR